MKLSRFRMGRHNQNNKPLKKVLRQKTKCWLWAYLDGRHNQNNKRLKKVLRRKTKCWLWAYLDTQSKQQTIKGLTKYYGLALGRFGWENAIKNNKRLKKVLQKTMLWADLDGKIQSKQQTIKEGFTKDCIGFG